MPEGFLKDQSVPARWRVLGIINGFLMNGKPFYGSNKWLMEQLDCSEQTVSNAFKELEAADEIETKRTRRSRLVYRKLKEPTETLTALGLRPETVEVSDPNQLGTNSDSISVSKDRRAKALLSSPSFQLVNVREDKEGNELETKKKPPRAADPDWFLYRAVLEMVSKEAGFDVATTAWDFKAVKKAKAVLGDDKHVRWLVEEILANQGHQKHSYSLSKILSAANLNTYKADL